MDYFWFFFKKKERKERKGIPINVAGQRRSSDSSSIS